MTYTVQHVKMRGRLWSMSVWSPIFLSSVSFHTLPAGGPSRYSTSDVQSTCWAGPPGVLHQSSAGRSGVFIALHKHGGGKESLAIIFIIIMIIFLSWYFVLFLFFNESFFLFSVNHRETLALGPTRLRPSGSWWRRGLCVSSHKRPSTHSGWITSFSCRCPWTRPSTQVL